MTTDLCGGTDVGGFDALAVLDAIAQEGEIIASEGSIRGLLRGGVVREGAVDTSGDGELRCDVFEAADVIGMDVRGEKVIEHAAGRVGEDVAGDPLARAA